MANRTSGRTSAQPSRKGSRQRVAKREIIESVPSGVQEHAEAVVEVKEAIVMERLTGVPPQHHQERSVDARHLSLPALNIIALICFSAIATYAVSNFKYDVQTQLKDVSNSVAALSKRIDDLTLTTETKARSSWSRLDMQLWCNDVEKRNKGFSCPNVNSYQAGGNG